MSGHLSLVEPCRVVCRSRLPCSDHTFRTGSTTDRIPRNAAFAGAHQRVPALRSIGQVWVSFDAPRPGRQGNNRNRVNGTGSFVLPLNADPGSHHDRGGCRPDERPPSRFSASSRVTTGRAPGLPSRSGWGFDSAGGTLPIYPQLALLISCSDNGDVHGVPRGVQRGSRSPPGSAGVQMSPAELGLLRVCH